MRHTAWAALAVLMVAAACNEPASTPSDDTLHVHDGGVDSASVDTAPNEDSAATDTPPVPVDCGFDATPYDHLGTTWQLASADGASCVRLVRRNDSEPGIIYKAVPYTVLSFTAGHQGVVETVTDPAALAYTSSHHNWMDVAEGTSATAHYVLNIDYDGTSANFYAFTLSALDTVSGGVLWGPVALVPQP